MRNVLLVVSALAWTSFSADFALSYGHANAFGGSTSHSWGMTGHGDSSGGSTLQSAYGGATTPRTAGYAYRPPGGAHAYGYHPPTTVGYYGVGCYNCGGSPVGAAAVGAAAVVASNAYGEGYSAGVPDEVLTPAPGYAVGVNMAALPEGCLTTVVHGDTHFLCGNSWFSPFYGASGVYYQVVPPPEPKSNPGGQPR